VKDQFGNHWWIGTHMEDLSKEEIERRMNEAMKRQSSG
jgi:PhnB protein